MIYKNLTYTIRKGLQRLWGYEIPLFVKGVEKEFNIIMRFEKKPDEKEITDMSIFWMDKIGIEDPVENKMFLESDILNILKSKNVISNTIMKIDDIPVKIISIIR